MNFNIEETQGVEQKNGVKETGDRQTEGKEIWVKYRENSFRPVSMSGTPQKHKNEEFTKKTSTT